MFSLDSIKIYWLASTISYYFGKYSEEKDAPTIVMLSFFLLGPILNIVRWNPMHLLDIQELHKIVIFIRIMGNWFLS